MKETEEFVTRGSGWPDLTGKTVFAYVAAGAATITLHGEVWTCNERGFGIDVDNPEGTIVTANAMVCYAGDSDYASEEGMMWVPWHALAMVRVDLSEK